MNWKSHILFGMLLSMIVFYIIGIDFYELIVYGVFAGIFALVPDLDHELSKGKKILDIVFSLVILAILYWLECKGICIPSPNIFVNWLMVLGIYFLVFRFFKPKHRGMTHSIVFAVILASGLFFLVGYKMALAGFIGYCSHLIGDKEIKLI